MFEIINENNINNSQSSITVKKNEKIVQQAKDSVCTINIGNLQGIGFLCKIPFPSEVKSMLVISSHLLNNENLKDNKNIRLFFENKNNIEDKEEAEDYKIINIKLRPNRIIKILEELKITLIEIIPNKDEIELKYFIDLDDNINNNINNSYSDLYIINNNTKKNKISISYNLFTYINEFKSYNNNDLNPSFIFSSKNLKIIGLFGINKTIYKFNNQIIKNYFINENNNTKKIKNKINEMTINDDIKENQEEITIFGMEFYKDNKDNCKLFIDNIEIKFQYILKLNEIKTKNKNLLEIKLREIKPITNLSGIFYRCKSLVALPDISKWDTTQVINMSNIFYKCISLKYLSDISKWNTKNVTNMSGMFYKCKSLKYLPDISKWDISNVTNISYIFCKCSSLIVLPDISKWNTYNVTYYSRIFYHCSSLISLPDIFNWNTTNFGYMSRPIDGCKSLESMSESYEKNMKFIKRFS